ncbi:hypothetical protein IL306_010373 [Fusarium sp. DS 682]|nr:hypothetical protein IL306_010373 [Fusarium sp. DS 682]
MSMVGMMQVVVKYLIEVNNSMSNTERLFQYTNSLHQGAPLDGANVHPIWPEHGTIEYEAVQMRYRPGLPLVVDDFSLQIAGGERLGIVGRTGAGKSTILSTLFALTYPGKRRLGGGEADGSGSGKAREARVTLDTAVESEGLNFSLGQLQLIALARALLRNMRIVLVDEGTSNVDPETDALVEETLATGLGGKTLIAIAHRLRAVIQYDRVCVMDKGRIIELGPPLDLWEHRGIFRAMCDSNGITREMFTNT